MLDATNKRLEWRRLKVRYACSQMESERDITKLTAVDVLSGHDIERPFMEVAYDLPFFSVAEISHLSPLTQKP